MMLASDCPDCTTARASARASLGAWTCECTCGRVHAARVVRVYRAADGDPTQHAPLARAGRAATALATPADAELARVRVVLCDLRPDHPDAYAPLPPPGTAVPTVRVTDPTASFGGIPRGLASGLGAQLAVAEALASRSGADVLREIAALPGEAAVVLRWMRRDASLASGLRGLHHDAGMHFASGAQAALWAKDLKAQRDAAPAHGRYLVLRACDAWERVMRGRGTR